MTHKGLWTILIVLIGVVLLFGAGMGQQYDETTQNYTAVDEPIEQNFTNLEYVDNAENADWFNDTVTVYNESDFLLVNGTDYDWYTNGSIQFYSTNNTTAGATATITYDYSDQTQETKAITRAMTVLVYGAIILLLGVAARMVLGGL